MLVESLGNVTFVNGILRVQCTSVDPEGKVTNSGIIEIPAGSLNGVLNGLINASKAIEEKLNSIEADGSIKSEKQKSNKKKNTKKK